MRPAADATLAEGRYRLQQRLGAGGMASVWLARDERLGRLVAVKIVADTLAGDEEWLRRFQREAQAAARLAHPGVVPVFDYGVEDDRPYLVMEYVTGGTLAQRLAADSGEVPPADRLARELLEALGAVHAAGILHRDVKPANLLLDGRGHIRLTDFGIAQAQNAPSLTRTGMVIGTVRYLAPEVAEGHPASIQSDLYSAGVVIREVAGPGAAGTLAALIGRLTADQPRDRPPAAAAALNLLAGASAAPTSTRPLGTGSAPTRRLPAAQARARPAPVAAGRPGPVRPPRPARGPMRPARGPMRPARGPARPVRLAAVTAAVMVAALVVILLTGPGGNSGRVAVKRPAPASAKAAVGTQVRALDRIVNSATRR